METSSQPFESSATLQVAVTLSHLCHETAIHAVSDPSCGAISTFIGITRNSHGGRAVLNLSYEAHKSMAERTMRQIALEARHRSGGRICRVYIAHRIGEVPVGVCSVGRC